MSKTEFTKAKEIKMLEEMRDNDSYLVDEIGIAGIDKMIQNIKVDFPIGTGVFVNLEDHRKEVAQVKKEAVARVEELMHSQTTLADMLRDQETAFINFKAELLEEILSTEYTGNADHVVRFMKDEYKDLEITKARIKMDIPIGDRSEDMELVEEAFRLLEEKRNQQ